MFGESALEEKTVLKKLPDEILQSLTDFMRSYCTYFELDGKYQHRLGDLISSADASMNTYLHLRTMPERLREKRAEIYQNDLKRILTETDDGIRTCRNNWSVVAKKFYQFDRLCREHGFGDA